MSHRRRLDNYDEARQSLVFPFLNGNHCYLSPECGHLFLLWVRLTLFHRKLFSRTQLSFCNYLTSLISLDHLLLRKNLLLKICFTSLQKVLADHLQFEGTLLQLLSCACREAVNCISCVVCSPEISVVLQLTPDFPDASPPPLPQSFLALGIITQALRLTWTHLIWHPCRYCGLKIETVKLPALSS